MKATLRVTGPSDMIAACSLHRASWFAVTFRAAPGGRMQPCRRGLERRPTVATQTPRDYRTDTVPTRLPDEDDLRDAVQKVEDAIEACTHIRWTIKRIARAYNADDMPEHALVEGDERPRLEHVGRYLLFADDLDNMTGELCGNVKGIREALVNLAIVAQANEGYAAWCGSGGRDA